MESSTFRIGNDYDFGVARIDPYVQLLTLKTNGTIELPGMITIFPDGSSLIHEGYTPDEAARRFWEAVALAREAIHGKASESSTTRRPL